MSLEDESENSPIGYLPSLDGVRGVAIFLVMMYHYRFFSIGWIGVDLFFVLSGFLISTKLIESTNLNNYSYYVTFWIKRILRIIPVYFLILILCFVSLSFWKVDLIGENHSGWAYPIFLVNWLDAIKGWPSKYTFIHFWSISCEMQFYLIWPFFLKAVHHNKRLLLISLITLVLLALSVRYLNAYFFKHTVIANYVLLPCRIDSFVLGTLLAVVMKFHTKWLNTIVFQVSNYILFSSIFFIMMFKYSEWHFSERIINVFGMFLNALFWLSVMFFAINKKFAFLSSTVLVLSGKYSYGMYLYHLPVLVLIKKMPYSFGKNEISAGLIAAILTYLISWLSYNLFEIKFLKLKSKF